VTRTLLAACLLGCVPGFSFAQAAQVPPAQEKSKQQSSSPTKPSAAQSTDEGNPPEEDESVAPEKFVLNPLESERNVSVGNQYWRKGKFRAAAQRYTWATKYDPNSPEAFFKLGEAEEKLKNEDAARSAFHKVITLAPNSKLASEAKKKIGSKG
jgi:tetratricopeptide (TPR) repeat protein